MSAHLIDAAHMAVRLMDLLDEYRNAGRSQVVSALEDVIQTFADTELADDAVAYTQDNGPRSYQDRIQRFHAIQVGVRPCTNNNCRFCEKEAVHA